MNRPAVLQAETQCDETAAPLLHSSGNYPSDGSYSGGVLRRREMS